MTDKERLELICQLTDWVYQSTETLNYGIHGHLAEDLVYLQAAIAKNTFSELYPIDVLYKLLKREVGVYKEIPSAPPQQVWNFIKVLERL